LIFIFLGDKVKKYYFEGWVRNPDPTKTFRLTG